MIIPEANNRYNASKENIVNLKSWYNYGNMLTIVHLLIKKFYENSRQLFQRKLENRTMDQF